jgi:hypothetical protein
VVIAMTGFLGCASSGVSDPENVDMCLLWGNTLDPLSFTAKIDASVLEKMNELNLSMEQRSKIAACQRDTQEPFIQGITEHCRTGTLTQDQLSERAGERSGKCVEFLDSQ